MIIAIHQPNYFPGLGFFSKIAQCDLFILLDDVAFSKNSYINRVQVLCSGKPKWLTLPVHASLGAPIAETVPADVVWREKHARTLENYYRNAACFDEVFPDIINWLEQTQEFGDIARINTFLVKVIATKLGLNPEWRRSSQAQATDMTGTDRLVFLIQKQATTEATYLSGAGGVKYQDPVVFARAGIELRFSAKPVEQYPQIGSDAFVEGLSVLDSLFNIGWLRTAEIIRSR